METTPQIPHSPMMEKSVLSVLINFPDRASDAPNLTEEHFHLPSTRTFYRYIIAQIRTGGIDTALLVNKMNEDGVFDRAGGANTLAELFTYSPGDGHFLAHVKELDRYLAYRKAIQAAEAIKDAAMQLEEPGTMLSRMGSPITEIQDMITGASTRTMTKGMVIESALLDYEAKARGEKTPMGIETSLPEWNRAFNGLNPQQTVVITAYPGGGKTTLATQLCVDAAMKGSNVLIISLEMPQVAIMNRMLAYVSLQPLQAITDPLTYAREHKQKDAVTKDMLQKVQSATLKIRNAFLEIEDMVGSDVHQISAVIRRHHRRRPLDVVAVDYAQRIRPAPEKARESREQQLSHASNLLADLSKELGFCLLLPSQLNKEGAAKHAEAINEDADIHCKIIQDKEKRHTGILVEKNRGGESMQMLPLVLNGPMIRFESQPWEENPM